MPALTPTSIPERVVLAERAVAVLSPRSTMWALQTLHGAPKTSGEVAAALPWLTPAAATQRVRQMHRDGLIERVDRPGFPRYTPTLAGHGVSEAQAALLEWHTRHVPAAAPTAALDEIEEALGMLRPAHTLRTLDLLATAELVPQTSVHVAFAELPQWRVDRRLRAMEHDRLVAGTTGDNPAFALTDRGRATTEAVTALATWARFHFPSPTEHTAATVAKAAHAETTGASRVPAAAFSHAPTPPTPTTPTAATPAPRAAFSTPTAPARTH
ncbi:winged helix-turn-helix transcriptional regulator [Streptomyces sp. SID3343]|uniref:winged helix-turn-helix transcriptional regulator n=1 Tax=Streptomyces sp. SID3343 TaxID=2690260 RepID=UPI00136FD9F5|nr:winged helix-turn-helix transcriptional regulator [Streptomyces sp. SID3343]MYV97306.1 hypothetical protein [Streptomyces sp. SID3343]